MCYIYLSTKMYYVGGCGGLMNYGNCSVTFNCLHLSSVVIIYFQVLLVNINI